MAAVPATVAIPVAILTFMAVNLCLVIAAIVLARQFAALAMFKLPCRRAWARAVEAASANAAADEMWSEPHPGRRRG
jgi:hypothetical protein